MKYKIVGDTSGKTYDAIQFVESNIMAVIDFLNVTDKTSTAVPCTSFSISFYTPSSVNNTSTANRISNLNIRNINQGSLNADISNWIIRDNESNIYNIFTNNYFTTKYTAVV